MSGGIEVRFYRVGLRGELILRADGKGERFARRAALNIVANALDSEFEVARVQRVRGLETAVAKAEAKARRSAAKGAPAGPTGLGPEDTAPETERCSEDTGPCSMRRKVQLVPRIVPLDACGVPDSELADFLDDEDSPTGKPMLVPRFCAWCGGPWLRSGEAWESDSSDDEDDDGEAWKKGKARQ